MDMHLSRYEKSAQISFIGGSVAEPQSFRGAAASDLQELCSKMSRTDRGNVDIAGLARESLIANCFEACLFHLFRYPISLHLFLAT